MISKQLMSYQMKFRPKNLRYFLGLILSLFLLPAFAQFPLEVQVNVAPPYPIRMSDFTSIESNVLINIQNTDIETYNVALMGTLRNEDTGATITSDVTRLRGACIEVPPGGTTLSGTDLRDLFNPDNLILRGFSREEIRGDEALPEGRYTLCIRAIDCNNISKFLSEIPAEPLGCAGFDVNYVDPPVLITPECEIVIPAESTFINIAWTQVMPTRPGAMIDYSIRIVEVEPVTRNPYDAILSSPAIFSTDVSGISVYNLQIPEEVILEAGRKYAIQITAKNEDGEIAFRNDGRSEVCTFTFGLPGTTTGGGFTVATVYPLDGDVIPFSFFPVIVRFDPFDAAYDKFISNLSISSDKGYRDSFSRDLRWPAGPLESQRDATGFSDLTEEQARHIAIYKNQMDLGSSFRFDRGATYTWNADVEIERRGTPLRGTVSGSEFKVGMTPSILRLPANNDTVPPGEINFHWRTGQEPRQLMPNYAIVQAHGGTSTFFNGLVDERWVIEVSKNETFTTIVNTIGGRLGYSADLMTDPETIKNELYKDLEENFSITENGRYYWRVRWMNSPDNISDNSHYASSPVWSFVISDSAGSGTPVVSTGEEDPGACISACLAEPVTNRTAASGLTVGSDLRIGKFTMRVQTITSGSGGRFSGEGYVTIPFMNSIKIQVEFSGVQYNSEGRIFAGTVSAKEDRSFVTETLTTTAGSVLSMSETEAANLQGFLEDGERLVSAFTGAREIGMPIGIDREIDGNRYIIGITDMEFNPERATLDAIMSFDFPQLGNKIIALGAKDLCITPGGLGDEGRLYLARDWTVVQEGETQFAFKGSQSADTTRSTYVSWDCRGFKCLQVRGEVTFPRSMFVPDNEDGTAGEGNVKGHFGAKACRGGNWLAMISFDPFQVNGLEGWGWNASNAWLDFSDFENPEGFTLPEGYTAPDARLGATWQGFYMERIEVRLPPEFASGATPDGRTTFGAYNVIIDNTGLSVSIKALNILEVSEGNFEGWGFAIDTLNMDFVSNTFREAGMSGRIGMPIFEPGDNLKYRMALGFDDGSDEFSYEFRVYTRDTLNIPMWGAAQMFFKPNSSIEIGFNDPERGDHATATLHGGIHLVGDFGSIPMLNFRGVNFEGLYLSTAPDSEGRYFKADSIYMAMASPQKSASGFPVSIENINFNINTITRPGIEFDFILNFSEGSTAIGAEARFGVFATFNKVGDRFEVGFGGVDVGRISIDVAISVMRLRGDLEFFKDDPTYGNGTRGSIEVQLPMNISGSLVAYFGTYGNATRGRFGTEQYFAYWAVDGMITFPGIPIFSGFAIYGFGGGAYHHMRMDTPLPDPQSTASGSSGRTSIRYVPHFDTGLGLKFAAVLGTHPSSEAFNMDVRLQAEFNNSYGLNFISVSGDGYFMASLTERGDAKVWATVNLTFDNRPAEGPKFDGQFAVFVRVGDFLRGRGSGNQFVDVKMFANSEKWFFHVGTPENRGGLVADLRVIQADLTSYLMVGHDIPVALPPLPPRIQAVLGDGDSQVEGEDDVIAASSVRERSDADEAAFRSGTGFAFGTSLSLNTEFNFAIFYASLGLDLGFDLNFMKPRAGSVFCAETGAPPRGIDGWYLQGQVYAGLFGEMGVSVDLMFVKGRYPFITLAAAAMMQGNFPDPTGFRGRAGLYYSVLGGLVEGRCNFAFSVGQNCTFVVPNPLAGMDFIADMVPDNGGNNQSCFSSPAVSFNLPVEKFIEFPVATADGGEVTRTFFPYIETFDFRKVGASATVRGSYSFASNNTEMNFRLDEMLEGHSEYEVRLVVKAREHFPNGTVSNVRNGDGSEWFEERSVRFVTGPVPDFIPIDQVVYSYPVNGQYYYLRNEGVGTGKIATIPTRNGVMELENPVNLIFAREIEGKKYRYFLRFTPVAGGEKIEKDLNYTTGRTMVLPLPQLETETMYAVQIVRKLVPPPVDPLRVAGAAVAESSRIRVSDVVNTSVIRTALAEGSTANIRSAGKQLLPGETVGLDEKLLYKFYFRTSRYNTLEEKLSAVEVTASYVNAFIAEGFNVKAHLVEPFDEFEVNGLYKDGRMVMKPLLLLSDPWVNDYHTRLSKPAIYDLHSTVQSMISSQYYLPDLNRHGLGKPPRETITVSDRSVVSDPIQQWQIEREANRNPAYNSGTRATITAATNLVQSSFVASASSTLNGMGTYQTSAALSGASSLSSGPLPNFHMSYTTSAYVWGDFQQLKQSLARAMSQTADPFGWSNVYPVRDLINSNPGVRTKVNRILGQSMIDYRYQRGTYTLEIQYRWPRGNGLYGGGTKVTRNFSY